MWQLILAPDVYDLSHVALFVKLEKCTHVATFLSVWWAKDRPSQVKCIMVFSVNRNGEIFVCGKSIDESSFGFSLLALYNINSYHSDAHTTKPAMKKNVTTQVHLFGLTNKATWPNWLMFDAKINCHVCLWICSLPVSVVTARIRHRWLCIIFTLLVHPLMTGLSIFQIDLSTFYFKFWEGSVCKICWHNRKEHLICQVWKWYHVAQKFCEFCDFSSNLPK